MCLLLFYQIHVRKHVNYSNFNKKKKTKQSFINLTFLIIPSFLFSYRFLSNFALITINRFIEKIKKIMTTFS